MAVVYCHIPDRRTCFQLIFLSLPFLVCGRVRNSQLMHYVHSHYGDLEMLNTRKFKHFKKFHVYVMLNLVSIS